MIRDIYIITCNNYIIVQNMRLEIIENILSLNFYIIITELHD